MPPRSSSPRLAAIRSDGESVRRGPSLSCSGAPTLPWSHEATTLSSLAYVYSTTGFGINYPSVAYIEPWVTLSLLGVEEVLQGKEGVRMSEQAQKVNKNIPQWAQGLYYNSGIMSEILVYHDDEAIYIEHRGKESGIVRFSFEMIEGLKIVEEEDSADSKEE